MSVIQGQTNGVTIKRTTLRKKVEEDDDSYDMELRRYQNGVI